MQTAAWLAAFPALAAALLAPGLAAMALVARGRSIPPPDVFLGAIALGVAIPAGLALVILPLGLRYTEAGPPIEFLLLLASAVAMVRERAFLSALARDPRVSLMAATVALAAVPALLVSGVGWDQAGAVLRAGHVDSTHAPYFPGDAWLQYRTAQFVQNRLPLQGTPFISDWFISDRTPLFGLLYTFMASAFHLQLPAAPLDRVPDAGATLVDSHGYWLYRELSIITNAAAAAPAVLLVWNRCGTRAASFAALLMPLSTFAFINTVFTWPKLLVGFFILCFFHWALTRGPALPAGAAAGLAVLAHPIGFLYLPGMLLYLAWCRRWRWLFVAGLGAAALVLPWFGWAALIYGHPSRMLTYPLGYIIRDPTNASAETAAAWQAFLRKPAMEVIGQRVATLTGTFTGWQFIRDLLAGGSDRVFGYNVLRASYVGITGVPLVAFGFAQFLRVLRSGAWWAMLGVPALGLVAFWGLYPEPIAQEGLQPAAFLWVGLAAALLARFPRPVAIAVVTLSAVELLFFILALTLDVPGLSHWSAGAALMVAMLVAVLAGIVVAAFRVPIDPADENSSGSDRGSRARVVTAAPSARGALADQLAQGAHGRPDGAPSQP